LSACCRHLAARLPKECPSGPRGTGLQPVLHLLPRREHPARAPARVGRVCNPSSILFPRRERPARAPARVGRVSNPSAICLRARNARRRGDAPSPSTRAAAKRMVDRLQTGPTRRGGAGSQPPGPVSAAVASAGSGDHTAAWLSAAQPGTDAPAAVNRGKARQLVHTMGIPGQCCGTSDCPLPTIRPSSPIHASFHAA